jgi:predicted dehydrogenase
MEKLKLGIIGMSEGNGHPYSWSAIINGYDAERMKNCPFPVIPQYLGQQNFPDDFLTNYAKVTHIYTQDYDVSKDIAKSAYIDHIVKDHKKMIGKVDAVLLARDDAENHFHYAEAFIKAGLPVYIDKPIAYAKENAMSLFALQKYDAQIYTCSALRYAKEFQLSPEQKEDLGKIIAVQGYTPKSWAKYAVHVVEPILQLLDFPKISHLQTVKTLHRTKVSFVAAQDVLVSITNLANCNHPISIEIIGENSTLVLTFKDAFTAFQTALKAFIKQVETKENQIERNQTLEVIRIIEVGI